MFRHVSTRVGFSVLLLSTSVGYAAGKKPARSPAASAPPATEVAVPPAQESPAAAAPAAETRSAGSALASSEFVDFAPGRYGFSYGFPDGGSPFGAGFVGARYFTESDTSVGGYLLLGNDSAAKSSSIGVAGKYQRYVARRDRINLYWFGQLTLGQNGGDANKGKDDFLIGIGGGGGLEFALLKDFTVSAEGGIGFNTLPDGESAFATGTSKLAVNFYY